MLRRIGCVAVAFTAIAVATIITSAAQAQGAAHNKAEGAALTQVDPAYGHDLFVYYCASCHGRDGRGGGPAAPSLKISPPDLTLMTARYGGMFPTTLVTELLTSGNRDWPPSHGSKDMPVWGRILRPSGGSDAAAHVRVDSLVSYLKTIQRR